MFTLTKGRINSNTLGDDVKFTTEEEVDVSWALYTLLNKACKNTWLYCEPLLCLSRVQAAHKKNV